MNKAEAIKIIRDTYHTEEEMEALETLIPEPKESEDEKIRKWIYNLVSDLDPQDEDAEKELDEMKPLALAWLEKQKEQKPAEWSEEDNNIVEELYGYFRYLQLTSDKEFSPSLSIDDILNWLKSLRPQPKQEVPTDTEVLTAKLVNLLKSYRIGEVTAANLANRIADTYGTQRYLDGLCDGKIKLVSEKKTWEGVDVDKYLAEIRGENTELYQAASDLVDAVERYMRQECLRSELAMKKETLKKLIER